MESPLPTSDLKISRAHGQTSPKGRSSRRSAWSIIISNKEGVSQLVKDYKYVVGTPLGLLQEPKEGRHSATKFAQPRAGTRSPTPSQTPKLWNNPIRTITGEGVQRITPGSNYTLYPNVLNQASIPFLLHRREFFSREVCQ